MRGRLGGGGGGGTALLHLGVVAGVAWHLSHLMGIFHDLPPSTACLPSLPSAKKEGLSLVYLCVSAYSWKRAGRHGMA